MRCARLVLAILLLGVVPARAQTPCPSPCSIDAGKSFTLQWNHDPTATVTLEDGTVVVPVTTGYKVYLDGKPVGTPIPVADLVDGSASRAVVAPLTVGNHTLQVAAYNPSVESKSAALSFAVKAVAPIPPTGLQILIIMTIAENGTVSFKVTAVEPIPK